MRTSLLALPLALSLATTLGACASGPVGNPNPPQPAKSVELDRYLGKWYEVARYDMRFQKIPWGGVALQSVSSRVARAAPSTCRSPPDGTPTTARPKRHPH